MNREWHDERCDFWADEPCNCPAGRPKRPYKGPCAACLGLTIPGAAFEHTGGPQCKKEGA